ncbi:MAG: chorismate lyase [Thauera sp.]|nr:chorismate lyase [Thauera sp.]
MRTRLHRETWLTTPPRAGVPPFLRPWLTDPASLTSRIRARCNRFSVRVVEQRLGTAQLDEAALLGLHPGERVWVREVLLFADDRPVVFGRSLLPRRNLRGAWNLFHGMGARPLGAALFADPAISRSPLTCKRFGARDARYHRARSALAQHDTTASIPREVWARRSLFSRHGRALLVSEFFLPEIFELPR